MSDILKIGLLLRDGGPIVGRKKLQKIVHVLQESGVDFEAHYELSHFGPYSSELKGAIDELIAANLIEEKPEGTGNVQYSVTGAFINLLRRTASEAPATWTVVAQELNGRDVGELEGISTILFLESRGWHDSDLNGRFKSLKPHLSDRFEQFLTSGLAFKKKRNSAPV